MTPKMKSYTIIKNQNKLSGLTAMLFIIMVFPVLTCEGQNSDKYGLSELEGLFESHPQHGYVFSKNPQHVKNEVDFLMSTGFRFYKTFLSSQDNPSCLFYPSCSEYSINAMQQKGLFLGILYSFDRLSRCHRLMKKDEYIFDESKERFYDPLH
jgi:putative component of membrane protein insertase Oxa1/YidC/SpoIIIJ protein YidD